MQLADAIRTGNTTLALRLFEDLMTRNEPALKIVATLVTQFRTWLVVKLMVNSGSQDINAMATAAGVANPKRIYFLQKEVKSLEITQLRSTLPILLELEAALKQGKNEHQTLQFYLIQLCHGLYSSARLHCTKL